MFAMGRKCFVPNCNSGYRTCAERVPLFKAPSDNVRLEQWRRAIPRADRTLMPTDHVCAKHFSEDLISRPYYVELIGRVLLNAEKRPVLSRDAVPTLFPICPKYLTRPNRPQKSPRKREPPAQVSKRRRPNVDDKCARQALQASLPAVMSAVSETALEPAVKRQNLQSDPDTMPGT